MSAGDISEIAETGDILLFRGKKIADRFQRGFTRSEYDHVAFMWKEPGSELLVVEAIGGNIVS